MDAHQSRPFGKPAAASRLPAWLSLTPFFYWLQLARNNLKSASKDDDEEAFPTVTQECEWELSEYSRDLSDEDKAHCQKAFKQTVKYFNLKRKHDDLEEDNVTLTKDLDHSRKSRKKLHGVAKGYEEAVRSVLPGRAPPKQQGSAAETMEQYATAMDLLEDESQRPEDGASSPRKGVYASAASATKKITHYAKGAKRTADPPAEKLSTAASILLVIDTLCSIDSMQDDIADLEAQAQTQTPDEVEGSFEISDGVSDFDKTMGKMAEKCRAGKTVKPAAQMCLGLGVAIVHFLFECMITLGYQMADAEPALEFLPTAVEEVYTDGAGNKRHAKGKKIGPSSLTKTESPWLAPGVSIFQVAAMLIDAFKVANLCAYRLLVVDGTDFTVPALHHRATLHMELLFHCIGLIPLLTKDAVLSFYGRCEAIWVEIVGNAAEALANNLAKVNTNTNELPRIKEAIVLLEIQLKEGTIGEDAFAQEMMRLNDSLKSAEKAIKAGNKAVEESLQKLDRFHLDWTAFRDRVTAWIASFGDQATRDSLTASLALWAPLRTVDGYMFDRDTSHKLRDVQPFLTEANVKMLADRLLYAPPAPLDGADGEGPTVADLAAAAASVTPLKRSLSVVSEKSEDGGAQGEEEA